MPELTTQIRARFHSWACSYQRPGWCAIGTTSDGVQVVTGTMNSPVDALRALLEAA